MCSPSSDFLNRAQLLTQKLFKWPRKFSFFRYHNRSHPHSWLVIGFIKKSNMSGTSSGAGTDYRNRSTWAHWFLVVNSSSHMWHLSCCSWYKSCDELGDDTIVITTNGKYHVYWIGSEHAALETAFNDHLWPFIVTELFYMPFSIRVSAM